MILKKRVFILFLVGMSSCSLFKPIPGSQSNGKASPFIENVAVTLHSTRPKDKSIEGAISSIPSEKPKPSTSSHIQKIEDAPPSAFQYAILLDVEVEHINENKLYESITKWWRVPYKLGGTSLNGIDCSAFVKELYAEDYSIKLPRTAGDQANFSTEVDKANLKEGDLVFFNTQKGISHVGLYLSNNKFVHASTSMGVIISDLNEPYWNKRFVKAGRIINFP